MPSLAQEGPGAAPVDTLGGQRETGVLPCVTPHWPATASRTPEEIKMPTNRPSLLRPLFLLLPAIALLPGCEGRKFNFAGASLWDRFPLDGERTWTYNNESADIDTQLQASIVGTRQSGNTQVVKIAYSEVSATADDGTVGEPELLFEIEWSTDSVNGIQVWGYADVVNQDSVTFDDPLTFAAPEMNAGESVTSSSNGIEITTTFEGLGDLGNAWTTDAWESAYLVVDDGDGDPMAGPPFAGHWWIATSWGVNQFAPSGYAPNVDGFDPAAGDTPAGENWYLSKGLFE